MQLNYLTMENLSFSFEGEDRIVSSLLRHIRPNPLIYPFYLDIGCNHPVKGSNTYFFYKRNYSGVCIDPLPSLIDAFKQIRPRDILISAAVTRSASLETLHIYENDEASSIDQSTIARYQEKFHPVKQLEVRGDTLVNLLTPHCRIESSQIAFVNIDVEGLDLLVLEQVLELPLPPLVICIENKLVNLRAPFSNNSINRLSHEKGYALVAKTPLNSIYIYTSSSFFDWIPSAMIK